MSLEDFGTIIALHQALREKLEIVAKNRGIMSSSFELKLDALNLGAKLFGTSMGDFNALLTAARKFNEEFQDWIESPNRCSSQKELHQDSHII